MTFPTEAKSLRNEFLMASARRKSIVIQKRISGLQLDLSDGEADFLQAILSLVGGNPTDSPRKYQESISNALRKVTGQRHDETDAHKLIMRPQSSGIWFANYPDAESDNVFSPTKPPLTREQWDTITMALGS
jgi:hypothetical protein